jgi:hypothetical protein
VEDGVGCGEGERDGSKVKEVYVIRTRQGCDARNGLEPVQNLLNTKTVNSVY